MCNLKKLFYIFLEREGAVTVWARSQICCKPQEAFMTVSLIYIKKST